MNSLTVKRVDKLLRKGERGRHHDGNGLYLIVNGKDAAHWERRYELHGKAHWMGLGSAAAFHLPEARERNRRVSQQLADRIDPLAAKRAQHAAAAAATATKLSFAEATARFVEQRDAGWSSSKHARQYRSTLEHYAFPYLGKLDVAAIDVPHVLSVLEQKVPAAKGYPAGKIWEARTVTADRVRNRIESVLSWAMARGYRPKGLNPAAWVGNLEHVLPAPSKVKGINHYAAMPYARVPALWHELAERPSGGVGVKALQFLILTAARSNEVIGARWDEINFEEKTWTVPGARMKGGKNHHVPLSDRAIELLHQLPREDGNGFVFVGARREAIGNLAMYSVLRRMGHTETIHGFRSAFSTWAHEKTAHSNHTIEMSLAHAVGTEVEKAYRRSDLRDKRRNLMEAWATFCTTPPATSADGANVVAMRRQNAS